MSMSNILMKSVSQAIGLFKVIVSGNEISFQDLIQKVDESNNKDDAINEVLELFKKSQPTMLAEQKQQVMLFLIYICQSKYLMINKNIFSSMVPFVVTFVVQSIEFKDKKIGYLAMSSLLECTNEVIYLCLNTIIKDILGNNSAVIVMALTVVSHIKDLDVLRQISPAIQNRINHKNPLVRKKAFIALHHVIRLDSDLVKDKTDHIRLCICETDPSVMCIAMPYVDELLKSLPREQDLISSKLIIILDQIVSGNLPISLFIDGICAPYTQITMLKIFENLDYSEKTKENLSIILDIMLSRYEVNRKRLSFAIQSQCLSLVFEKFKPTDKCFYKGLDCLKLLLQAQEPWNTSDILATGLEHLTELSKKWPELCINFQNLVMASLEHTDLTIQKQTLLLLSMLMNERNYEIIFKHILRKLQQNSQHLHFCDCLVENICPVINKLSKTVDEKLSNLHQLMISARTSTCRKPLEMMMEIVSTAKDDDLKEEVVRIRNLLIYDCDEISFIHFQLISWIVGEKPNIFKDLLNTLKDLRHHCLHLIKYPVKEFLQDEDASIVYLLTIYKIAIRSCFDLSSLFEVISQVVERSQSPAVLQILGQLDEIRSDEGLRGSLHNLLQEHEEEDLLSFFDQFNPPEVIPEEEDENPIFVHEVRVQDRNDYIAVTMQTKAPQPLTPFINLNDSEDEGDEDLSNCIWRMDGYYGPEKDLIDEIEPRAGVKSDEQITNAIFNLSSILSKNEEIAPKDTSIIEEDHLPDD